MAADIARQIRSIQQVLTISLKSFIHFFSRLVNQRIKYSTI